ncbi:MAG: MarR family transcriptional regulator [Pseudomonadota bacterium]
MSTKRHSKGHRIELARTTDGFMRRLHAGIQEVASVRDTERVGPLGGMVLMAVEEFQPVSMGQLVVHLARDKAQMTRIIHQLETKGLILRTQSKADARSTLVNLTGKGKCVVGDLQNIVGEVVEAQLAGLDEEERVQLLRLMRKAIG